jgi:quinol monooxygenase YgiN
MPGQVRVVLNMHVAAENAAAFEAAWVSHAAACRAEPGAVQFEIFRSLSYPENYTLLELWEDEASFRRHFAKDHGRAARSTLVDLSPRRSGEDGFEIYHEQILFAVQDGAPVRTYQRGWSQP